MPAKPKILFVLTSCGKFPDGGATGWDLPEFAHPYLNLKDDFEIVVASPHGGPAPLDPASVADAADDKVALDFMHAHATLWTHTTKLSEVVSHAKDYAAVFFVGGHGAMFDLAKNADAAALVLALEEAGRIVAAVCHGPAALCHPSLKSYLAGEEVTGFADQEEQSVDAEERVPFSLEKKLGEMTGGGYKRGRGGGFVVVAKGGRLVTGENPDSAAGVARKVRDAVFGELVGEGVKK